MPEDETTFVRPARAPTALADATVIVTGAAHGIGAAISVACAAAGARLVLADRDAAALTAVATSIGGIAVCVDVSTAAGAAELVTAAMAASGTVDVLINNAAAYTLSPLHECSDQDWDATLDGVLRPVFTCARAVLAPMLAQGAGAIVNISSVNQRIGAPHHAAYAAAKGAITALTRQMAVEYGPAGIRCNSISPGLILTERLRAAMTGLDARLGVEPYPRNRFGRPEDVAAAAVFLASPAADFITGVDLPVDGGLTALSPATVVSPDLRRRWGRSPLRPDKE